MFQKVNKEIIKHTTVDALHDKQEKNRYFEENSSVRKNTLYNILKTFSTVIFPLITFPYISRVLGTENIGKINFGNSIVSYFSLIASLGINAYAIRECSKVKNDREALNAIASRIYSINIVTTIVAYLLLAICLATVPQLRGYRGLILIQSISIICASLGTDWINTAMEDFRYITIRTFVFQGIALLSMFIFIHKKEHYIIYAVISLISSSGAQLANIIYRKRFCRIQFTKDMQWRLNFPPIIVMFVMILSQSILNNLDTTMLGFLKGDEEVGLYSTAVKVTNIVQQLTISITWVVLPQITFHYRSRNYNEINKLLRYVLSFTVVLGLPCLIGINFFAEEIVVAVGGEEYIAAANCLRILSISMLWGYINNIFGNLVLLPSNREKRYMFACITSAGINAITNAFFIPALGIYGASITTAISNMITTIINFKAVEKEISFGDIKSLFRGPVIGTLFVSGFCIFAKYIIVSPLPRLFVAVVISVAIYFLVLLLLRDEFLMNSVMPPVERLFHKIKEKKEN